MVERCDVVVVGGGPVGLAAAWRLLESGFAVVLLEAEPGVVRQLRASTFHPPTLDLFDESGVTAELIATGRVTPSWQVRVHETGEHVAFDLGCLAEHTAHPYRLQCEQHRFSEILVERIVAIDAGALRWGATAVGVGQDEAGTWVDYETADGGRRRIVARYVVGCDGARSIVRERMGVSFEGAAYPETTILATTPYPFDAAMENLSGVNYVWTEDGTYSLLRLPDLWRVSLHPEADEPIENATAPEVLQRRLRLIHDAGQPYEVREVRPYRVHRRLAGGYRAGRMFLAGDAAHLNNPKGGMGMNGGIHDAFNLTDKLARVFDGADDGLLDLYERQRLPVARDDIIAQADRNRDRMWERGLVARRARIRELRDIADDPARRQAFLLRSSMIEGLRRAESLA